MAALPPPDPVQITSFNTLPLASGQNEPEVTTIKSTISPEEMFDGGIRRTVIGSTTIPANNDGPLQVDQLPGSGIVMPGALNAYFLDLAPGFVTPIHRTVSIDYLVVIKGTPSIITPKGPFSVVDGKASYTDTVETVLAEGQVLVQRGQMHALANNTESWVRFWCVVADAKPQHADSIELREAWL
ncbi:hypothetical protein NQ176_g10077 [Zarea fungicola]|uniref:Uncharacterized protein n=1 Tax=Zarea fungicola TaxID=93591 RepID=A0ACC1MIX0_9HYPO|nr:hypothetical protein NQ176_g10077 [Lecanicillium fungicola]